MPTDIKLDQGSAGTTVLVEAGFLKTTASDFLLDAPGRRKAQTRPRRALVHDQGDGLTINFNNDYPGGVTINDVVALHNRRGLALVGVSEISGVATTLEGAGGTGTGGGGSGNRKMLIRGELLLESRGVKTTAAMSARGAARAGKAVSLQALLNSMAGEVAALRKQVATLERRVTASGGKAKEPVAARVRKTRRSRN